MSGLKSGALVIGGMLFTLIAFMILGILLNIARPMSKGGSSAQNEVVGLASAAR